MTTQVSSTLYRFVRNYLWHNPFYLLSAALMLAGCLALTNSLSWSPIRTQRLIALIAMLQIYEFLLIALGLYLLRRRKLNYDGTTVLVIAGFFLVDVTFLSGEIANAHETIGWIVNSVLVLLAVAKLAIIFHFISLPVASLTWILCCVQLLALYAIGWLFKRLDVHIGRLPPAVLYGGWWLIALLPLALTFVHPRRDRWPAEHHGLVWVLLLLPLISLIAHLSTSNFVFNVRWYNANVSPLLIGLAMALARVGWHERSWLLRYQLQFILPIVSMLIAAGSHTRHLEFVVSGLTITPLRLAAGATVLAFAHAAYYFRSMMFAVLSGGLLSSGLVAVNFELIRLMTTGMIDWLRGMVDRFRPRTLQQWGVLAVVGSFVSLAIGALISLRRRPTMIVSTDAV